MILCLGNLDQKTGSAVAEPPPQREPQLGPPPRLEALSWLEAELRPPSWLKQRPRLSHCRGSNRVEALPQWLEQRPRLCKPLPQHEP